MPRPVHGKPAFVQFARRIWTYRQLLGELVRRELTEAYAGSILSRLWAVVHPILLISLYLFVFGFVFTTRVGVDLPSSPDFAVFMLSGLAAWLSVQAGLARATVSLIASSNLVKQVVFPVELLPVRSVLGAQLPLLIGLILVVVYSTVRFQMISPLLPLVIYVLLAQTVMLDGISLFLSAMTVFVRDTRDVVQFFTAFGVFLVPVIYLPGSLPGWFETVMMFNPFSHAIWCLQDIFFFQSFRHPWSWLVLGLLSVLMLQLGSRFFERTRANFGDVL